jgi:predicted outer membrane protein
VCFAPSVRRLYSGKQEKSPEQNPVVDDCYAALYCGSPLPVSAHPQQEASFMDAAIEANVADIELGMIAESKAADPRVKAYAEMLVKDHTKALKRLQRSQDIARSDSTELSLQHRELRDRLSGLSGPEFDTAYVNAMIEEHQKDIKEFERQAEAKGSTDSTSDSFTVNREKPEPVTGTPDKVLARELLPMLKMHLREALELQQQPVK